MAYKNELTGLRGYQAPLGKNRANCTLTIVSVPLEDSTFTLVNSVSVSKTFTFDYDNSTGTLPVEILPTDSVNTVIIKTTAAINASGFFLAYILSGVIIITQLVYGTVGNKNNTASNIAYTLSNFTEGKDDITQATKFKNYTTAQKNALVTLPGDTVYDTDLSRLYCWNGTTWNALW